MRMRELSAAALLAAWEHGLSQSPLQRALTLLAAACPESAPEALAQLSMVQREGLLLPLRERLLGSQWACMAVCPACGQKVEMAFEAAQVRAGSAAETPETPELASEGWIVQFRLP